MFLPLACDFLGEKLAGVLGLNTAKYQYAVDEHQRDNKVRYIQHYTHIRPGVFLDHIRVMSFS